MACLLFFLSPISLTCFPLMSPLDPSSSGKALLIFTFKVVCVCVCTHLCIYACVCKCVCMSEM